MVEDKNKDLRHYLGALGIFILIICLLLFLSFIEIPPVNKDLFVAIVGTLVSSLGMVVYTIVGQQPDEVNRLQKKNESLTSVNNQMENKRQRDYMKYWRVIRYFVKRKYKLNTEDLDMLFFLL